VELRVSRSVTGWPYASAVLEVTGSFSADASSVPRARRFVTDALTAWNCDDAGWAAAQIVAELAGNCALHARTEFVVRLLLGSGGLRLEVTDSSPTRPQLRQYGAEATTGRGLQLVEVLSDAWGVDQRLDGKTVWVQLRQGAGAGDDADAEAADATDVDALLAAFDDGEGAGQVSASADLPLAA
jgi:anti-sigma regulatory factor (Ser/Thr protein kinase)